MTTTQKFITSKLGFRQKYCLEDTGRKRTLYLASIQTKNLIKILVKVKVLKLHWKCSERGKASTEIPHLCKAQGRSSAM